MWNSFGAATRGIRYALRNEQNFRVQVYIALLVGFSAWVLQLRMYERIIVVLLIMWILALELLNTVIEKFLDVVHPRLHTHVEVIKDIMAAVVCVSAFGAACIGIMIFLPHIIELFVQ